MYVHSHQTLFTISWSIERLPFAINSFSTTNKRENSRRRARKSSDPSRSTEGCLLLRTRQISPVRRTSQGSPLSNYSSSHRSLPFLQSVSLSWNASNLKGLVESTTQIARRYLERSAYVRGTREMERCGRRDSRIHEGTCRFQS